MKTPLNNLFRWIAPALLLSLTSVGCSSAPSVNANDLQDHQATIDPVGLIDVETIPSVDASAALPLDWEILPPQQNSLYTHQQWRSQSKNTGLGIIYVHLPIPVSPKVVIWLAQRQYAKKADDGQILDEWTDSLNRQWFEAQNKDYHARGFIVTRGREAWISYCGYDRNQPINPNDFEVASRALDTIAPMTQAPIHVAAAATPDTAPPLTKQ